MAKPPRFDSVATKKRLQRDATHASTAEGPRTSTDHLLLSPEEISLEGPYVRQHMDEEELVSLEEAIVAGGEIRQAIGVRMEGTPLEPRFVLVYGMRRWLASRRASMARIPVRNHGRISVAESLALQVTENEARVDPHPVDTAVSYQLLVQEAGMTQAEVARVAGRSAAHVSYMRAVGEAILRLDEVERTGLYAIREATVPRFQKIAPLKTIAERVDALRELLASADTPRKRPASPHAARFRAGHSKARNAWSVRLSYRDDDVMRDPELAARLERFLEEQLERLREQTGTGRTAESGRRRPVSWEIELP